MATTGEKLLSAAYAPNGSPLEKFLLADAKAALDADVQRSAPTKIGDRDFGRRLLAKANAESKKGTPK
jgi:hypothetical protein